MATHTQSETIELENAEYSFKISGRWNIEDFIQFLNSIDILYGYYVSFNNTKIDRRRERNVIRASHRSLASYSEMNGFIKKIQSDMNLSHLDPFSHSFSVSPLELIRIQYASPGNIDFLGIGKIFEQLKEILFKYVPSKKDKIEIQLLEQKRIQGEIKLFKEIGLTDLEIRSLMLKKDTSIDVLNNFILSKKLTEIAKQ